MKHRGLAGAIAGTIILVGATPADARFTKAERNAARAVEQKVERHLDWEEGVDVDVAADCEAHRGKRYVCEFNFWNGVDASGQPLLIEGKARVKQSGTRYTTTFRIYW